MSEIFLFLKCGNENLKRHAMLFCLELKLSVCTFIFKFLLTCQGAVQLSHSHDKHKQFSIVAMHVNEL